MQTEYTAVVLTILVTIGTSALLGHYMANVFSGNLLEPGSIPCLDRSNDSSCAPPASTPPPSRTGSATRFRCSRRTW